MNNIDIIEHLRAFINYNESNCNQRSLNRELNNLENMIKFKKENDTRTE